MMMEKSEVEGSSGFMHGLSSLSVNQQDTYKGDEVFLEGKVDEEKGMNSCTSSSSIGTNSDVISEGSMVKTDDSQEVESPYKGPLSSMEALEQVLPMRKGMSRFYNGKSKSFTSLREASSSSSMNEIGKPENGYIKKRRKSIILACGGLSNKKREVASQKDWQILVEPQY